MRNEKPGETAMAANSLLDRGWGRPRQQIAAIPLADSVGRVIA